ncbi:MAG: NRDE family protein [Halieaceae bacterium]|nr:NRDE family protein [Halieaceae bacterium]
MCLITLAHRAHDKFPLVVAANRDEYYQRPTRGIHFWEDHPQLLAGRDLRAGGTWMGITRHGRFAAITNYRGSNPAPADARSRGMLTLDFLAGSVAPADYLQAICDEGLRYAGFNLLVGDREGMYYLSNIEGEVRVLEPGIHSISNGLLDSGWPKQRSAETLLAAALADPLDHEQLARSVSDRHEAADEDLPDTGVELMLERALSPQFITMPEYGTRATTTLAVNSDGCVEVREQDFHAGGVAGESRSLSFSLETEV